MKKKRAKSKPVQGLAIIPEKKIPSREIMQPGIDGLITMAIQSKASVENLKELMAMKYEHEAREAKKVFHQKFSELQSALPVIIKSKQVDTKTGKKMYKYAPLPDIQKQVNPVIFRHGFSYHWSESFEREKYVRIFFTLTGYGHSESSFIDIPIQSANDYVNSVQQAGSSNTYGKRYSMCNLLGIVADEDDDGGNVDKKPQQNNPPAPVSQPPTKAPEKKSEPIKYTLPKGITPETLCDIGPYKDKPKPYKDIRLDYLLTLWEKVTNPSELDGVISWSVRANIEVKIGKGKYDWEKFNSLKTKEKLAEYIALCKARR